ncbi:hypothetical protein BDV59DRAFT_120911 [Aspergillus ambiguus]|uniref:uncharacterized protein n=1 Tax=Aspergillus ambiguus TaxID=176160 RepID=UPI003CCD79B4
MGSSRKMYLAAKARLVSLFPASWQLSIYDYRDQQSSRTAYIQMLIDMEKIPMLDNMLATFYGWVLLAGYLVLPGTFTSIRTSRSVQQAADKSEIGIMAYSAVQNVPLLAVAALCCAVGLCGSGQLSYRRRDNFVWLARKVFLPIFINSITGFVNTIINIYTARGGAWSVTATVTASVTGTCALVSGSLFLVYNNWLFARLEKAFNAAAG